MKNGNDSKTWYHGSPFQLTVLCKGSTITPDGDLARVFSHKPRTVSIENDGTIKHDGSMPGFLYRIAEKIQPGDVTPHPHSSMAPGKEWLIHRELRVTLIGPTQILETEMLTAEEIRRLARMRKEMNRG